MRHGGFVLGYHGCDRAVGERILVGEEEVVPSRNDYDWLGGGAYFWENSPSRALQWAKFLQQHPSSSAGNITEPFVIGAIIDPGNCLDLSEDACLSLLKETYDVYAHSMGMAKIPLPKNEGSHSRDADLVKRKLDCAILNFLHDLREVDGEPAFDTVRCPFFEGGSLYPDARIAAKTHIQCCVRNPSRSVIGYFRHRSGAE